MQSRFLLSLRGRKKGQTETEVEAVLQDQCGGATLLSERVCTRAPAEAPREPREAGVKPSASEEAPTEGAAQEITAPCRPRRRRCGRSVGAPSVRKNSQTRPRAAGARSSRAPRRTPAPGWRRRLALRLQPEPKPRVWGGGLRWEALGPSAPLREGGREGKPRGCAPSPSFKSAPGEIAPAAARPTAAARPDTPARPGRDLLRSFSEQLNRGGVSSQSCSGYRQRWAHPGGSAAEPAAPHLPAPYGSEQLARTMRPALLRAPAPRVPEPSGPQSAAELSWGPANRPVASVASGGPVCSQCACSSHSALHSPTSGTWAGATTAGLLGVPVSTPLIK